QVLRRGDLAERLDGGEGERREAGGGGGEAAGGGEGVAGGDPQRLLASRPVADAVEVGAHPAGELRVRRAEAAVRLGAPDLVLAAVVERHRERGVHRRGARQVARSPVLHEGDIGRRGYGGLAHASVSPRSPGA